MSKIPVTPKAYIWTPDRDSLFDQNPRFRSSHVFGSIRFPSATKPRSKSMRTVLLKASIQTSQSFIHTPARSTISSTSAYSTPPNTRKKSSGRCNTIPKTASTHITISSCYMRPGHSPCPWPRLSDLSVSILSTTIRCPSAGFEIPLL